MNTTKMHNMLTGIIAGEALGLPFDGLSRAHIQSVFKSINTYTDTTPALKGRLQTWKKPCLYGSFSQFLILFSMSLLSKKHYNYDKFKELLKDMPESADNEFSIFRHPGSMMMHFIKSIKDNPRFDNTPYSMPGADSALLSLPLFLVSNSEKNLTVNVVSFSVKLTKDTDSTAGAILFSHLLNCIIRDEIPVSHTGDLLNFAIEKAADLNETLKKDTAYIFESGLNPDKLQRSMEDFLRILESVLKIKDKYEAEKVIYTYVNNKIKTPVTRATVNLPMAVIPYSIFYTDLYLDDPSYILFNAASEGGASQIFCSLTGALTGSIASSGWIPDRLLNDLINKKQIHNLTQDISKGTISDNSINIFMNSEISLTAKEIQEKNAKLKHVKVKSKKKKSRMDIEKGLSAHVVESWTKLDRAKWRRKMDRDDIDLENEE